MEEDKYDWTLTSNMPNTLQRVAAIDISYSKTNEQNCIACLLVFSYPDFNLLYEDFEQDTTAYPYIPGFLAFKEVPVYTILFNRLKTKGPQFWP